MNALSPSTPTLADVLDQLKDQLMVALNCHAIGTIKKFDASKQTVSVKINYDRTYYDRQGDGTYKAVLVPYPLLIEVPAIVLVGGTCALTLPIAVGDQCLVLFNDRDIDNWTNGARSGALKTPRKHSIADGIALIGLSKITDFDEDRAVLKNGTTMIAVGTSKIEISNTGTTLNTLLQSLITDLNTLITAVAAITVTCATPGSPSSPPINAAAIVAVSTSLTTLGTQIGGLLE